MKFLLKILIPVALLTACGKDDTKCPDVTITAPASEVATLKTYIDSNHVDATADPRGFYYKINAAGSGSKPNACSNVLVGYNLRLLNSTTILEESQGVSFNLSQLIVGWQEGIPLIGSNGSIILYLPPSLAYGSQASPKIPANSYLKFEIVLKQVN